VTSVLRPGAAGDAEVVAALETACLGREAWSPTLVADGLAGGLPHLAYLVVEEDGGPVGYAAVSTVGEVAELQRVAVDPARRRTGLGRTLLDAVDDHARSGGATRVLLEVREDNDAARALYADHGYAELSRRPRYYRDGTTAVVLERLL